jgi:hypothetical protein
MAVLAAHADTVTLPIKPCTPRHKGKFECGIAHYEPRTVAA